MSFFPSIYNTPYSMFDDYWGDPSRAPVETVVRLIEPASHAKPKIEVLGDEKDTYRRGLQMKRFTAATQAIGAEEPSESSLKIEGAFKPKIPSQVITAPYSTIPSAGPAGGGASPKDPYEGYDEHDRLVAIIAATIQHLNDKKLT
jgi:hypothetical protein